jgi:uncharacterized protein (DUF983 family)
VKVSEAVVALGRGSLKRCPRCGNRRLFLSWFRMKEACNSCGLPLEREVGGFLGAIAINYGVTGAVFIAILVAVVWATVPDVPVWPLLGVSAVVTIGVPLLFYPFSKTIWLAIDLVLRGGKD